MSSNADRIARIRQMAVAPPTPASESTSAPVGGELQPQASPQAAPTPEFAQRSQRIKALASGEDPRIVDADQESGAPKLDRLAAAFKFDKEGVTNYLKEKYGAENVLTSKDGEIYFRPPAQDGVAPDQQKLVRFNPKGVDIGDIVEYVPATAAGILGAGAAAGASMAGLGAAATVGVLGATGVAADAAIQGVGKMLPGKEAATDDQRALRAGVSGAFEAAAPGVGKALTTAGRFAKNLVTQGPTEAFKGAANAARSVLARGAGESVEAAQKLEKEIPGMQFTLGQQTQKRSQLATEGYLRQNIASSGIGQKADAARLDALAAKADSEIAKLGSGNKEDAGNAAINARMDLLKSMHESMKKTAAQEFGEVRTLAGKGRIVPTNKIVDEIDAMKDTYEGLTEVTNKLDQIKKQLVGISGGKDGDGKISVNAFQNKLSSWSYRSFDPRALDEKILNRDISKEIATRIFRAHVDTLDELASGTGVPAEVAAKLTTARDSYKKMATALGNVRDNPLGDYTTPEKLVDDFLSPGKDSAKLRSVIGFLDKESPAKANEFRSGVLRNAIDRSMGPSSAGAIDSVISPAKLSSFINKNQANLDILLEGNPEAKRAMGALRDASARLANTGGTGGSQTQFMAEVAKYINPGLAMGAIADLSSAAPELGTLAASIFTSRVLSMAMNNPVIMRNYATVMRAAANGAKPTSTQGRAARQALVDIGTWQQRLDSQDFADTGEPDYNRTKTQAQAVKKAGAGILPFDSPASALGAK